MLYLGKAEPYRFSQNDKRILELFTNQAAIAIENARLYEQRHRDIAALQEINEAITTRTWTEIEKLIIQKARELTQADYGGLWIVDGDHLVLGEMFGQEPKERLPVKKLPIDEHSINGLVAMTGESYNCPDVSGDAQVDVLQRVLAG